MQKIYLYNTKTKKKEEFIPLQDWVVKMYSCGPTVYNYAHIWNLRSYIFPDILKKTMKLVWYDVKDLINFTDVWHLVSDWDEWEDKMEKMAKKSWKDAYEISEFYSNAFKEDLKKLNIWFPIKFPKATDYIEEQINLVKKLEEKWFTYKTSDWIYFDTEKFPDYWKFANIKVDELKEWVRVDFWEKKSPTDFALWKFSWNEKRQMEWKAFWEKWFPGWHLECTAMIFKELWEIIDIHTWWTDHIRIHHTNEIAQAECLTWKNYVNYWLHWEFLVLDKKTNSDEKWWKSEVKMSKSSWNFITIKTLEEKWFNPIVYRFFALQNNYRKFLTFSFENLKVAERWYLNLKKEIKNIFEKISDNKNFLSEEKKFWENFSEEWKIFDNKILEKFCDNISTPQALVLIRDLLKEKNISPEEKIFLIKKYDEILWLNLLNFSALEENNSEKNNSEIPENIKILIEKRKNFKKEKNFSEADKIKEEIFNLWFEIKDTRDWVEIKKYK
jgi:cysteinyl-tRNA synthetase